MADYASKFTLDTAQKIPSFLEEIKTVVQDERELFLLLSQIKNLEGLELRMSNSARLRTWLYSFTSSPGGQIYPTRVVRYAARDVLDAPFLVVQYWLKRNHDENERPNILGQGNMLRRKRSDIVFLTSSVAGFSHCFFLTDGDGFSSLP